MNDRFKFRIFYSNKMVYPNRYDHIESIYECLKQQIMWDGAIDTDIKFNHIANELVFMQCTGLKDKNGTLIYEGDIMNVLIDSIKPHYIKQVVVWDRKEWQLKTYNKDYRKNCSECGRQLRTKCKCCSEYYSSTGHTNFKEFYNGIVIGNIYENKELLNE